jgi:hypothetical protein
MRCDRRDLAREVIGREATFAETVRERIRRRDDPGAAADHRAEECHRHQGLRDVVELELVDAEQAMVGERADRLLHPEEPDQARELGEREVSLRRRRFVPRRRE